MSSWSRWGFVTLFALAAATPGAAQQPIEGRDGQRLMQPDGWSWTEGRDGRRVVYPDGWSWTEGRDGRRVVYPSGWNWSEGPDGRRIVYPSGWSWTDSRGGRRVAYPGDWNWMEGRNGQRVPYGSANAIDLGVAYVAALAPGDDLKPYLMLLLQQMGVVSTP